MKLILLRDARLKRGWTQERLARESGVHQATVSKLEAAAYPNPTLRTRDRLANALRVSPAALIFRAHQSSAVPDSTVSEKETAV